MEKHINVSVIIPVYNVKDYLEQCINSVIGQTIDNIEVILVDDGSTDGSEVICDKFASQYENISVYHKENGGQGSARNIGIKEAKGKYIYFLDSDDYIVPDALMKLFVLAEKEDLEVIFFASTTFTEDKKLLDSVDRFKYEHSYDLLQVMTGKQAFISMYENKEYHTSLPIRFYQTAYIKRNGFEFVEHKIHEDEDFGVLSCVMAERVMIIKDKLFYRRLRRNSTMTSQKLRKTCEGYQYAFNSIRVYIDKCGWDVKEKELLRKYIMNFLYAVMAMSFKVDKEEYKKNKDALCSFLKCVKIFEEKYSLKTRFFIRYPSMFRTLHKLIYK